MTSEPGTEASRSRKDWLVDEALSQAVYLLLVVGLSVAVAKRDWLARQRMRLQQATAADRRRWRERLAVLELRADLSAMEHADTWDGEP